MTFTPFQHPDIEHIYDTYPAAIRQHCLLLRQLIFDTAADYPAIGPIEETLRWGEPSYMPSKTNSGSMIRIHHYQSKPFDFALYFLCQTTLVDTFRELYPDTFRFGGNRSLEFMLTDILPLDEIKACIRMALMYYLDDESVTQATQTQSDKSPSL